MEYYNDINYLNLVKDILENDKFAKTDKCRHHGITRMQHSLRVSYHSYRIAKKFRLNYQAVARAGLLHDFFIQEDLKVPSLSAFEHPYRSISNASKYFNLNDMEKDIIITHMFPTLPHKIPKYLESWLVSLVDKVIATYEFYYSYGHPLVSKLSRAFMFLLMIKK